MNGTAGRERTHFGSFLREVAKELTIAGQQRGAAPAPGGPKWRQLFKETLPIQGESLRGLVARACQRNDLPNSWGLLQHLGQRHRNRVLVAEDPNIDSAELAYAIRVAEKEVRARRYEPVGPRRWSFFGLELYLSSIERRIRRFSPTALSDAGNQYHRATWELRDIPFCFEGWDMLQDRCGCERNGVIQGWTRTSTRIEECDECGDPLHWLEPFPVPASMRPALSLLEALVDPRPERRASVRDRLPPGLRNADRSTTFHLVLRMAAAIDPEATLWPIDDPVRRLHGLHSACHALERWPDGIEGLAWHPSTPPFAVKSFWSRWSKLPSIMPREQQARTTAPLKKSKHPPAPIRILTATKIAKLSPQVLLEAWERRLVTRRHGIYSGRTVPAFDPDEIREFGREWKERKDPETVARALAISYHGIEQMVALNVIRADAKAFPATGPHFTPKAIADFLSALTQRAQPILLEPIPLIEVLTRIGGRPKPWGPIFEAMLQGDLCFGLRAGRRLAKCIVIPASQADQVCAANFDRSEHPDLHFQPWMTQRDALEMLNVSETKARLLHGLAFRGTNPKSYAAIDVEKRASEIVSIPEIAAILMTDPLTAYWRLKSMSAREVIPGGWDRQILAKLT